MELGVCDDPVPVPWKPAPSVLVWLTVVVAVSVAWLMVVLRVMCDMPVAADAIVLLLLPPDPGAIRVPPGRRADVEVELMLEEDDDEEVVAPPEMENMPL